MITIIEGNILEAKEDVIVHQVNCRSVMGSGLAKQIREKYPEVYEQYITFCSQFSPHGLLGKAQKVYTHDDKIVFNLFGQLNYGRKNIRYTDYDALKEALTKVYEDANHFLWSVALPYNIGCGLANGNWDRVYEIIDDVFRHYPVTLYKI
jgi:O-acetyl-ADP-ribose deacetylase (regulator of RNase III)